MCEQIEHLRDDIDGAFEEFSKGNDELLRIQVQSPATYKMIKASFDVAYTYGRHDQARVDAANLLVIT